ncbi:TPA: CopG family transcriptional regulator, partial [Vibrio cholerae]
METLPTYIRNDIYDIISKDTFELVAYHLSLNFKDTSEYSYNKKIFSIDDDNCAISLKISSIETYMIDISFGTRNTQLFPTSRDIRLTKDAINNILKIERQKETISFSD